MNLRKDKMIVLHNVRRKLNKKVSTNLRSFQDGKIYHIGSKKDDSNITKLYIYL